MDDVTDDLPGFSDPTRVWFAAAFAAPTAAQVGAWDAIAAGKHALVVAPTGSGKTLVGVPLVDRPADRDRAGPPDKRSAAGSSTSRRSRRSPSTSSATCARRWPASGTPPTGSAPRSPDVAVGVRSGDTTAAERRKLATSPPDILITTPESLFLMLTSQARESLRGVETVIVDEVHAVAGTKRGAHLAVSLERLDELLEQPAQRIGLSATVRPVEEVARFLGGAAPVEVVARRRRRSGTSRSSSRSRT